MKFPDKNKITHLCFDIALIAKAIDGLLEIIGGVVLFFVSPDQIHGLARWLTQEELAEDPTDFIANHLRHASQHLSTGTTLFAAFFLLWHGLVKVGLVWALLRKHLWAYPVAIVAFALFVAYQLDRYAHTRSAWLLALSVLDVFVIVITALEFKRLRGSNEIPGTSSPR
jgi:uncharacterized membrane protein